MSDTEVTLQEPQPIAPKATNGKSPALKQLEVSDDEGFVEYLQRMSGGAPVQVKITRLSPRQYKGHQTAGLIETVDELIPEEEIKDRHGGGKYEIKLFKRHNSGKWVFAGQRTIEIAGPPKIYEEEDTGSQTQAAPAFAAGDDPSLSKHTLNIARDIIGDERQEKQRLMEKLEDLNEELVDATTRYQAQPHGPAVDPDLLRAISEPLKAQIEAQQETIQSLNEQIKGLLLKPPDTSKDELLKNVMASEGDRVNSIRLQHESELRSLRQSHQDDLKRSEDRFDRIMDNAEKAHNREVDNLRRSHDGEVGSIKLSFETRLSTEQAEISRLKSELSECKAELRLLRDKKDKPFLEQMQEIATAKEAFAGLFGSDDDEEEEKQGFGEKLVERFSPLIDGIGARLAGGGVMMPGGVSPEQLEMMRQQQAIAMAQQAQAQQVQRQQAQAQAQSQQPQQRPQPQAQVRLPQISQADLQTVISYIETCINNDVDPMEFAKSSIQLIPPEVLKGVKQIGIDKWLESVAKISDTSTSPITTQKGRNWLRNVQKALTSLSPG
jgi:hypothetical protein